MAGRPADFFEQLRKKLGDTPTREQDRQFWAKFDAEFGTKRPLLFLSAPWRDRSIPLWSLILPIAAIFLLAIVIFSRFRK